jgi:hypothetical protein
MNTPNDLRWLLFATVPTYGHFNFATPVARGIVWLFRRAADRHNLTTATAGGQTVP